MRNKLIFLLLCCLLLSSCLSVKNKQNINSTKIYDIKGNPYIFKDSLQYVIILYKQPICSACLKKLFADLQDLTSENNNSETIILCPWNETAYQRRILIDDITNSYKDANVYFDKINNKKESVFSELSIQDTPAILFKVGNNYDFFPSNRIFQNDDVYVMYTTEFSSYLKNLK